MPLIHLPLSGAVGAIKPTALTELAPHDGPLFPALGDGGWGYISQEGRFVIPPRYTAARRFSEGLAAVYVGGLPSEGKATGTSNLIGGLWGFIDRSGTVVIEPQFVAVGDFSEGLAAVAYGSDGHQRWGFINRAGEFAIKPQFAGIAGNRQFDDGEAWVTMPDDDRDGWEELIFVDRAGRKITKQPTDREVGPFQSEAKGQALWGLREHQRQITPPTYADLSPILDPAARGDAEADARRYFVAALGGHRRNNESSPVGCSFGVINDRGEVIVDFNYSFIDRGTGGGIAAFTIGGNVQKIPCQFPQRPSDTRLGLLRVADGKIIAPPQFDRVSRFSEGLIAVEKDGKWGWLDADGQWVVAPRIEPRDEGDADELDLRWMHFIDGLAYVGDGAYVDRTGRYINRRERDDRLDASSNLTPKRTPRVMGSAFFVGVGGIAVTNAHVVRGCKEVINRATRQRGDIVAVDAANDLALLAFGIEATQPVASIRRSPPQLGEDVVVFGFPLVGLLSSEGVVTTGSVSAVEGVGGDSRYFQISAPIHRGNSGGPVLDRFGSIIGISTSSLNSLKVISATGEMPQNINFAIKADYLRSFLNVRGLDHREEAAAGVSLSNEDLASRAKAISLNIECIPVQSGR